MGLDEFTHLWNQLRYLVEIVIVDSKGTPYNSRQVDSEQDLTEVCVYLFLLRMLKWWRWMNASFVTMTHISKYKGPKGNR